jgi:hypothetical protein
MALLDIAEQDAGAILESATGFSVDATFSTPDGLTSDIFRGDFNAVKSTLDLSTGVEIVSQSPSITIRKNLIDEKVSSGPLLSAPKKNWRVIITIHGDARTFYISEIWPDERLGIIVFRLQER